MEPSSLHTRSQGVIWYLVSRYAEPRSLIGPLVRAYPFNDTTRQVLSLRRLDIAAYLENLWAFNRERRRRRDGDLDGGQDLYAARTTAGMLRRFNQLPCTVDSRKRRADLLGDLDPQSARILVLGDDDLLAVELARRGFAHVTVADCDEVLLERIRQATAGLATPPNIVRADFRQGFSTDKPMDVVFLDPPYSIGGAQAFLDLAVAAAGKSPGTRIYLMINPDLFGVQFSEVIAGVKAAGFSLARQVSRFNAYPIGWFEGLILRGAWRFMLRLPGLPGKRSGLEFCSDCFEFRR